MKNKFLLLSAVIIICLATSCDEKHKNYAIGQKDTINAGDSTNNIQNSIPPNDTLKK